MAFLSGQSRRPGRRLVWVVHNLGPHDRRHAWLGHWLYRLTARHADGFVALSEAARSEAVETFSELETKPSAVVPHGHYRDAYPTAGRKGSPSDENERVILCLGRMRPYKGLVALVDAFRATDDPSLRLWIVGKPHGREIARTITDTAAKDRRIRVELRYVPDEELETMFAAATLAVLPYEQVLNSGSAILALSFDRPVLAPDLGSLSDLARDVGPDWVRTFRPPIDTETLLDATTWAAARPTEARPPLDGLSWSMIGKRLRGFLASVLAGDR